MSSSPLPSSPASKVTRAIRVCDACFAALSRAPSLIRVIRVMRSTPAPTLLLTCAVILTFVLMCPDREGFVLEISHRCGSVDQEVVVVCPELQHPRVYNETGGVISPLGFVTDNMQCAWLITNTVDQTHAVCVPGVTVEFEMVDLQENGDFVLVFDGPSDNDPIMVLATGSALPAPVVSTQSQVLVILFTNPSVVSAGFTLHYELSCVDAMDCPALDSPESIVTGPGVWGEVAVLPQHYHGNMQCAWVLANPEPPATAGCWSIVALNFAHFNVNRQGDFVAVYDGDSLLAPRLRYVTGISYVVLVVFCPDSERWTHNEKARVSCTNLCASTLSRAYSLTSNNPNNPAPRVGTESVYVESSGSSLLVLFSTGLFGDGEGFRALWTFTERCDDPSLPHSFLTSAFLVVTHDVTASADASAAFLANLAQLLGIDPADLSVIANEAAGPGEWRVHIGIAAPSEAVGARLRHQLVTMSADVLSAAVGAVAISPGCEAFSSCFGCTQDFNCEWCAEAAGFCSERALFSTVEYGVVGCAARAYTNAEAAECPIDCLDCESTWVCKNCRDLSICLSVCPLLHFF
jgi:hypothetical protein